MKPEGGLQTALRMYHGSRDRRRIRQVLAGARALAALVAASLLISQAAGGLYSALDRSQPEIVSVLGNLLLSLSVIAWSAGSSRGSSWR